MENKITEEQFEKLYYELVINFLNNATLEQRHQLTIEWNYDDGYDVLNWVVDAKDTDKATILALYWMLCPEYHKQYKDRDDVLKGREYLIIDDYDLFVKLEKNYIAGYYQEQNIEFDPANDIYSDGTNWTSSDPDVKTVLEIPAIMFTKLEGKKVILEDGWLEGIPPHVDDELNKLRELL